MEILMDAGREGAHARSLNYVSLVENNANGVTLKDEISGKTYTVSPRLVINATGPWIDKTNRLLGLETKYVGPTKGSHLVVENPELRQAIGDHEIFFENNDGRIVLIFPLFDKVLIGTTDIPVEDVDSLSCTEEEVEYFIEMISRVFPGIVLSRDQIIYRFSGARPLAYSQTKNAGQITRDHHIHQDSSGEIPVFSLVGGKWTSYRAFSEQATDHVLSYLGLTRKTSTASLQIGMSSPGLKTDGLYSLQEIARLADLEKVVHLDDLVLRRTLLAYLGQLTRPRLEELSVQLGKCLNWDAGRQKDELDRTFQILVEKHGVRL